MRWQPPPLTLHVPEWARRGVRAGVHVGESTIVPGEWGLLAGAEGVPPFGLVSLIWGEVVELGAVVGTVREYAFAIDDGTAIIPAMPIAVSECMWAAANEDSTQCNCGVVGWFEAADVVPGAPRASVLCYALHAGSDGLAPFEEVTFHYGAEYACVRARKRYVVGRRADFDKADVPASEKPAAVFGVMVRRDAIVVM